MLYLSFTPIHTLDINFVLTCDVTSDKTGLKQHEFILQFCRSESEAVLSLLKSRCWPGCVPFCRLYRKICFHQIFRLLAEISFCAFRTKVPIFLLVVSERRAIPGFRNHCIPLCSWPPGSIFTKKRQQPVGLDAYITSL